MRFSRHARNRARRIGVTVADAEAVVARPAETDTGQPGKIRYIGYVRGRRVRVVIALDDPDLVVTIHGRRR